MPLLVVFCALLQEDKFSTSAQLGPQADLAQFGQARFNMYLHA